MSNLRKCEKNKCLLLAILFLSRAIFYEHLSVHALSLRKNLNQTNATDFYNSYEYEDELYNESKIEAFREQAIEQKHYPLPNTLDQKTLLLQFRERQEKIRNFALKEELPSIENSFIFAEAGVDFDFNEVVQPVLNTLLKEQDPDFFVVQLVRLLYHTDKYTNKILPVLEKLPLWITKGEKLRVYWSENHMIMYSSSMYLLRQKFGHEKFSPADDSLRNRILWYLNAKIQKGFYEFYSNTYMRFTLCSLLNLYDFSDEEEISELARVATLTLLKEWMFAMNTNGISLVVSGRTSMGSYVAGGVYGSSVQEVMALATGIGPLTLRYKNSAEPIGQGCYFLAQSKIDVSEATQTFKEVSTVTRRVGHSYHEGLTLFKNLTSKHDRYTAQMSQGGYAHPDYIVDTFKNVNYYDLWQHKFFESFSSARDLPGMILSFCLKLVSSRSQGSLVNIHNLRIYKNHNAVLSSINNFNPGYKGYQQTSWIATTGDMSVYTMSAESSNLNNSYEIDNMFMNNQLPYVWQDDNVALIMYNPNADLWLLGVKHLEVMFSLEEKYYDDVIDFQTSPDTPSGIVDPIPNWIFARRQDAYVGVFRHCMDHDLKFDENGAVTRDVRVCFDKQQIWAVIVGHNTTHGSFDNFVHNVGSTAKVIREFNGRCITGNIFIDGKEIQHEFCRYLGNALIGLICLSIYVVLQSICCFACCRKKRRLWKRFVSKSTRQISKTARVACSKTTSHTGRTQTLTSNDSNNTSEEPIDAATDTLEKGIPGHDELNSKPQFQKQL